MNTLREALQEYLRLRRGLGYKMHDAGLVLARFVSFMEERGAEYITVRLALECVRQAKTVQPAEWARRLCFVRGFARYRSAFDPRTEVPPPGLLPYRSTRAQPYLYSEQEVQCLLDAALKLPTTWPSTPLRPWVFHCLLGLLSVTGMRISEALDLRLDDVDLDQGVLTVRSAKLGRLRLVPLHPSTCAVLANYLKRREQFWGNRGNGHVFVSNRGTRLDIGRVHRTFYVLSRQIGLRAPGASKGPRLHDFRHHADNRIMPSHRQLLSISLLVVPSYGGTTVFRRGIIRSSLRTDTRVRKEKRHAERVLQTERFPRALTQQPAAGTPRFVCDRTGRGCLRGVDGAFEASLGRRTWLVAARRAAHS